MEVYGHLMRYSPVSHRPLIWASLCINTHIVQTTCTDMFGKQQPFFRQTMLYLSCIKVSCELMMTSFLMTTKPNVDLTGLIPKNLHWAVMSKT